MTDQHIEDAYRRMNTALAPPVDATLRVERRIRGRRARRRVVGAGVAGLVVAGVVAGAALVGDGDDPDHATAGDPSAANTLVLTRPDGSTFVMTDLELTCDPPRFLDGLVRPRHPQRIWLYSPLDTTASGVLAQPFAYFEADVTEVDGRTFQLPSGSLDDPDQRAFTLFAADQDATSTGPVFGFSSAETGAAGTVVVERASCDPTPVLELEVDTTLGGEVQQGTVGLTGSYE